MSKCKHKYTVIETIEINGLTGTYPVHKIKCKNCGKEVLILVEVWDNLNK